MNDASAARRKTRREKYGPRGHGSSYSRWTKDPLGVRALALVIQLHREEVLSEGQCCAALDLDRVDFRRLVDGGEAVHEQVSQPIRDEPNPIIATAEGGKSLAALKEADKP